MNKLDHDTRDPFDLTEEIETVLGIGTYPMNWPIGSGRNFRGVFDRASRHVLAFEGDGHANATKRVNEIEAELGDPALDELIGEDNHRNLMDDIELLDGADHEFDLEAVRTASSARSSLAPRSPTLAWSPLPARLPAPGARAVRPRGRAHGRAG